VKKSNSSVKKSNCSVKKKISIKKILFFSLSSVRKSRFVKENKFVSAWLEGVMVKKLVSQPLLLKRSGEEEEEEDVDWWLLDQAQPRRTW
jgi:hypothetical protein